MDPRSLIISMEKTWNLYMAREYDHAIAQAPHTLEMAPEFVPAQYTPAMALAQKGRYEEAAAASFPPGRDS